MCHKLYDFKVHVNSANREPPAEPAVWRREPARACTVRRFRAIAPDWFADETTSGQLAAGPDSEGIEMIGLLCYGTQDRWHYRDITATSLRYRGRAARK
jgi:hypothetical protein